jgi:hypothetical protein
VLSESSPGQGYSVLISRLGLRESLRVAWVKTVIWKEEGRLFQSEVTIYLKERPVSLRLEMMGAY